jgi:hypothetical protein
MLRRRTPALPYLRLKDWADSGEALTARCESCAAEQPLRPATLVARHGWHGVFAKAVSGVNCVECGGATTIRREPAPEQIHGAA